MINFLINPIQVIENKDHFFTTFPFYLFYLVYSIK